MNINYKLYLSIGLLFSIATPIKSTSQVNQVSSYNFVDSDNSVLTEEECDQILHDIIENCFFNDNDTTRFSDIVTRMIEILQVKVRSLDVASQKKCNEFIALLEKNKNVTNMIVWAKIFTGSDLISLLPKKTQDFLNQISNFQKSKALLKKLQNN